MQKAFSLFYVVNMSFTGKWKIYLKTDTFQSAKKNSGKPALITLAEA